MFASVWVKEIMDEVAECHDKPGCLRGPLRPASIDWSKLPEIVANDSQNAGDAAILVPTGSEITLHLPYAQHQHGMSQFTAHRD